MVNEEKKEKINRAIESFRLPPRKHIARLPTPIHKLTYVSAQLGVDVYVKRDDLTGFQLSGNKIRKLDFLLEDAQKQGCNTLVTWGGVQSNHCRATAALAAMRGMECVLVLRGEAPETLSSNHLLHRLFAATILFVNQEQFDNKTETKAFIDSQVRARGGKAYFIPEGGDCPMGAMGYLDAWREIKSQLGRRDTYGECEIPDSFDSIFTAVGTGGTQAGLILGRLLENESSSLAKTNIFGVNVCYDKETSFRRIKDTLWQTIQKFQMPLAFMGNDIRILGDFLGLGYAISASEERALIFDIAKKEGIVFDPTYSGKAFKGLWDTLKNKENRKDFKELRDQIGSRVLFIHTGGGFGLFQHDLDWQGVMDK